MPGNFTGRYWESSFWRTSSGSTSGPYPFPVVMTFRGSKGCHQHFSLSHVLAAAGIAGSDIPHPKKLYRPIVSLLDALSSRNECFVLLLRAAISKTPIECAPAVTHFAESFRYALDGLLNSAGMEATSGMTLGAVAGSALRVAATVAVTVGRSGWTRVCGCGGGELGSGGQAGAGQ